VVNSLYISNTEGRPFVFLFLVPSYGVWWGRSTLEGSVSQPWASGLLERQKGDTGKVFCGFILFSVSCTVFPQ
jgi:hypothetical protein